MVLLSILQLQANAYGAAISGMLEAKAERRVSRGALYSSLDRLERKGYLRWEVEPPTPLRAGQPVRRFEVTGDGLSALRSSHQAWMKMTDGLGDVLSPPVL